MIYHDKFASVSMHPEGYNIMSKPPYPYQTVSTMEEAEGALNLIQ